VLKEDIVELINPVVVFLWFSSFLSSIGGCRTCYGRM